MKEKIFDFDKINSLILFLLIFTNLRKNIILKDLRLEQTLFFQQ